MTKNNKSILGWCFYDFANSSFTTIVVTFIYSAFFADYIVGKSSLGQIYWGNTVTICAIIIAILSPIMGAIADQGGLRKTFLFFWTAVCIIFSALLYFPQKGDIYFALGIFIVANVAFEMGCVFCNAYVPTLTTKNNMGKISGYGYAFGYLGGLLALVVGLVTIALPDQPLFGITAENGQNFRSMNLLVAIWFFIFSIPTFLWLKKDKKKNHINKDLIKSSFKQLSITYKDIKKYKNIIRFLIARLFYNDALITIFSFGGIIAKGVYNFNLEKMLIFGIVLGVTAGIGAYFMGFIDDKIGAKKTIQISNFALVVATVMVVFSDKFPNFEFYIPLINILIQLNSESYFWIAGILVGFSSGPNQSSSRALMSRFTPQDKQNEFFGFFAFSGKITAFLGPFLLAQVTHISLLYFDISNETAQRLGVSVVLILLMIGSVILSFVNEENQDLS